MALVYLSIGSNLGDRKALIRQALSSLSTAGRLVGVSRPYHTKPYGVQNQPDFINMAAALQTGLDPEALLDVLQRVEEESGRVRKERWGSRTLDLDILFYDNLVMTTSRLVIPHYDLHNRWFVLKPLSDICPLHIHPVLKTSVTDMLLALRPDPFRGRSFH